MPLNPQVTAPEYETHVREALDALVRARSFVAEVLYSASDTYVREELLTFLSTAELKIRKALA